MSDIKSFQMGGFRGDEKSSFWEFVCPRKTRINTILTPTNLLLTSSRLQKQRPVNAFLLMSSRWWEFRVELTSKFFAKRQHFEMFENTGPNAQHLWKVEVKLNMLYQVSNLSLNSRKIHRYTNGVFSLLWHKI